jgi:putative spermidine/putrescine transport system ATP-binding protein
MNQGIIEQAASARDVYARPRSPYVARFLGGQNVLHGRVLGTQGAWALLEGHRGARYRAPLQGPTVRDGETMWCSIRRDQIRLRPEESNEAPAENAVRGQVEAVEYQGTFVKVTLSDATGEEFIAHEPEAAFFASPVSRGDRAVAYWAAEQVHPLEPDRAAGSAAQPYAEAAA